MASYNIDDYVTVNTRIEKFYEKYPDGSIQTELISLQDGMCIYKAYAYSDREDTKPCTGHAYEKEGSSFINKTSYIENCETSAVGRALAMMGFEIKKSIASREEVENAKLQQEMDTKITKQKADVLYKVMLEKGLTETTIKDTLQKSYGVDTVYELTAGQYGQILHNLNK
jgi:hypothetical protein